MNFYTGFILGFIIGFILIFWAIYEICSTMYNFIKSSAQGNTPPANFAQIIQNFMQSFGIQITSIKHDKQNKIIHLELEIKY